jgi:hypothetical protein
MIKIIYFDSPKRNSGAAGVMRAHHHTLPPGLHSSKKKFVAGATHFATLADRVLPENKENKIRNSSTMIGSNKHRRCIRYGIIHRSFYICYP